MVFSDTFNNISVISWRSVLLVEETRVPEENHRPVEMKKNVSFDGDSLVVFYYLRVVAFGGSWFLRRGLLREGLWC